MSTPKKLYAAVVILFVILALPFAKDFAKSSPSVTPARIQHRQAPPAAPARQSVQYAPPARQASSSGVIENAFRNHTTTLPVTETGRVSRLLSDDNQGSRHQRFIVSLPSGHTVLIAHNIDIAPRINSLREGDQITFSGVYEWNDKGGVVHWTHHDPSRRHTGGYLVHNGMTYQ